MIIEALEELVGVDRDLDDVDVYEPILDHIRRFGRFDAIGYDLVRPALTVTGTIRTPTISSGARLRPIATPPATAANAASRFATSKANRRLSCTSSAS
jgi:hypothetical protein